MSNFSAWLSTLLGQSDFEVCRLLEDETALHFLIAWSLFESKCFAGYVKLENIENYSTSVATDFIFKSSAVQKAALHFHFRYQDEHRLKNLLHRSESKALKDILLKPVDTLAIKEHIFLVTFVIYRFRNNIFHGNKGVASWLKYREQIELCTDVMQELVSNEETRSPTEVAPLV